ncbi:Seipin family [Quillaja saponaria]|uniref:Seipin family n=1 Tax=Quillaja saponaria TaxID=32244 RepID=A0AAD7PUV8_QUISA|nr:Seipin family [Quillaja saponaria]
MDPPTSNNEEDDTFSDAVDDFPFYDFTCRNQPEPSASDSTLSDEPQISNHKPKPEIQSPANILRRRSIGRGISGKEAKDSSVGSSIISENESINDARKSFRQQRRYKIQRGFKENEKEIEKSDSAEGQVSFFPASSGLRGQNNEDSTITTAANDDPGGDSAESAAEIGDSSFNLLIFIAGLVIKATTFQINLFITFITFPLFFLYHSLMFLIDPFRTLRKGKDYVMRKLFQIGDLVCGYVSPSLHGWLKEQKSFWKVALRCAWGLFWSIYVCFILVCLLVSSLVISGWLMKYLVEEPIRMKETLNFDYTKQSPVAYVPIISCAGVGCGEDCTDNVGVKNMASRIIPPNHRLQVTVSLLLPESEYNRNLGVFQVRADFLSVNGKTLASTRHPCMLQFKSEPIRLIMTFLKIAPLVTGYISEDQTLNVKMRGLVEGDVPSACLKVTIEQRAEYRPGAGIPEIYDASLVLESELPFFKRIIWYWKKTIYIWISMMSFMMELLFALVCCRPIIIPRARQRDGSSRNRDNQNNHPTQI